MVRQAVRDRWESGGVNVAFHYLRAVKPRIVALFLVTAVVALVVSDGTLSVGPALAVLMGILLVVSGSALLNNVFDRDLDRRMTRTHHRPTAEGTISTQRGAAVAILLVAAGLMLLFVFGGSLSAAIAFMGVVYYSLLYTLVLKPRLSMSTLPGSLAGVFPPLIAWAAAGAFWSPAIAVLCLFVFFWSLPHFWALALARQEEYARAGIPTPAGRYGERTAKILLLATTIFIVALSALPAMLGLSGWVYLSVVLLAGGVLVGLAARLLVSPGRRDAQALHKLSGPYLTLLLVALALSGYEL